ncbi:MAG: sugar transferase [Pseudomonadota bacterium]
MAAEPAPAEREATRSPPGPRADVRSGRPYLLFPGPLKSALRRLASIAVLAFLDISGVALGLYTALAIREFVRGSFPPLWGVMWQAVEEWLPFLALITLLVFWQAGLYASREVRAGVGRILPSLVLVALLTAAFAVGSGHEFDTFGLVPTSVVTTAVIIGALRASYEGVTRDLLRVAGVRRHAILVGAGEHLLELRRALGSGRGGINYEFAGAVTSDGGDAGLPRLGGLDDLPAVLANVEADELIVAEADVEERRLLELVEHAHRRGVKVRVAPKTTELLMNRAEYVPGQAVPLFELRPPVFAGADWLVKRAFDLVVSTFLLVVGLPLWLLVAAAIKLDSPGPVLYRSRRVGLDERPFAMLKFRTMVAGAEARQRELEEQNEATGALFKIRDDPRVTRVGAFLRRFSLDELPQVLNVLRGEMSLVGPRPLPLRDYEQLQDWHRKRYLVLPGMTGLWQISGRSELSFDDLVRLDFYYLDNWSIWLDVSILLKTLPAVVDRRGAY